MITGWISDVIVVNCAWVMMERCCKKCPRHIVCFVVMGSISKLMILVCPCSCVFFFSIIAHAVISSDNFLPRLLQRLFNMTIYVTLQNKTIFLLNKPWSVSCLWKYMHQSFSYSSVNQKNMICDAFVMKYLLKNNSCVCEESTPKEQRCLTNKGNPIVEI